MKKKYFKLSKYQPILISIVSLFVFILVILQYTEFSNDKKEKDSRDKLFELLISKKSQLEKALYSRIYYTKGIAAYCSINPEITNGTFYKLADELIKKDTVISSMSLSKDCIISAIYPIEGHESAIGLNLLEHPLRRKIVEETIKTRNTFVAGPVSLIEGGIAFVSYTPIFTKNDSSHFWGVTDIVILKDKLFKEVGLSPVDKEYKYSLKGVDGTGMDGECFWGNPEVFKNSPVTVDVLLPTGKWVFGCTPINGWQNYIDKAEKITIILYISAFIISILIWLLSTAIIKIRENERELKAMFGSMQDLVIEFNKKGEYVKIAPTNESLLVKPARELLGKSLYQVFDKEKADYFFNAISECIETKQMIILDYPLIIDSQTLWFHARISYLSDDSVMYIAHDNTLQKETEMDLRQSKQKLIESNAAKDKFFSIIAHDLRSPFLGLIGVTEELKENVDDLEKTEISEFANLMHSSAKNTFELLNNLLEWARLQTGKMAFKPVTLNIHTEVEGIKELFNSTATIKSITISNNVRADLKVFADKYMFSTILRNLISNSIKFTKNDGKIIISAEKEEKFANISVLDTGIGMNEDIQEKVFKIDSIYTTKGTNGEKGTGLGLVLCKELVEKNGGKIKVISNPGKGTEFMFTLPLL